jgi:hypothetical protein
MNTGNVMTRASRDLTVDWESNAVVSTTSSSIAGHWRDTADFGTNIKVGLVDAMCRRGSDSREQHGENDRRRVELGFGEQSTGLSA